MDGTIIIASYGALVSTLAVAWNVYRDFHDRARLELSAMVGYVIEDRGRNNIVSSALALEKWPDRFRIAKPSLFLTITNTGRRPVVVQGWAIRTDIRKTGNENFLYPLAILPKALKEGEYAVEHTIDLSLLADGARRIYAWDSTGKEWSLPRRALHKLQKDVQRAAIKE